MAADFTPNLNPYSGQGSFRFWVQKVLPLVYDDSLSYYELLCKVVNFLNNVIQDMDTAEENIELIRDAYNQLQTYVNTYFDNLDIEAELDDILMKWVEDGRLEDALTTTLTDNPSLLNGPVNAAIPGVVSEQLPGVVADQIDAVVGTAIEEQVPPAVSDWLNENVDPVGSAVVVDSSLTVSGAAADAKVTGDKINTAIHDSGLAIIHPTDGALYNYTISTTNTIQVDGTKYRSREYKVDDNWKTIKVQAIERATYITYLTNSCSQLGNNDDMSSLLVSGQTGRITIPANTTYYSAIPTGTKFICITVYSLTDRTPSLIEAEYNSGVYVYNKQANNNIQANDMFSRPLNIRGTDYSNSHMRVYTIANEEDMLTYDENKNPYLYIKGSKFIRVTSGTIVNFMCGSSSQSGVTGENSQFVVYFYNDNMEPIWNVIDYFSDTYRNKMTVGDLRELTGLQITANFTGYIKISKLTNFYMYIGLWDGYSFGLTSSTTSGTLSGNNGQYTRLPNNGECALTVPANIRFAIAKPGYTFVNGYHGSPNGRGLLSTNETLFPCQCIRLDGVNGYQHPKTLIVRRQVTGSGYPNPEFNTSALDVDTSEYFCLVDFNDGLTEEKVSGGSDLIVERTANYLTKLFLWTPVKDINSALFYEPTPGQKVYYKFKQGVTYHGVPYRSSWSQANNVGWHVTKQTFQSAVNDPDSIFYNGAPANKPGPYYCLVCSNYATLINRFNAPSTNWDMMHSPVIGTYKSNNPVIGNVMTNGVNHCITPMRTQHNSDNSMWAVQITEEAGYTARYRTVYSNILSNHTTLGADRQYTTDYNIVAYPKYRPNRWESPYNIETAYTDNPLRTARPDHGDYSVYTDLQNIIINVKDANATYIYYCAFNVTVDRGVVTVTPTRKSEIKRIPIADNLIETTETSRRVMFEAKNAYLRGLENGEVYGVWCGDDNMPSDIPEEDCIMYFEYHTTETEYVQYYIQNGELHCDSDFWYAIAEADNYQNPYRSDKVHGLVTIPHENAVVNMDGSASTINRYKKYANNYHITNMVTFIRRGKFGAYKIDTNVVDPDEPDDPVGT